MCEYEKISGRECPNEAYANVTVEGNKGVITIDVCEEHLEALTSNHPTEDRSQA